MISIYTKGMVILVTKRMEAYGSIDYLAYNNDTGQCIAYRTWCFFLEKAETYVVLVGADSWRK